MADAASDRVRDVITWAEGGVMKRVRWQSESGLPAPARVEIADDTIDTGTALRKASEGTALLWRGDFNNARQLLAAMTRRIDARYVRHEEKSKAAAPRGREHDPESAGSAIEPAAFHRYRMHQAQRARTLGMLLLPFEQGHRIPLRRAPVVADACNEAWGRADEPYVTSLRELQGAIGAYEWRKKGVEVSALGDRVHPHYGVFAPIRSEYVGLVARAPLSEPLPKTAFDIGTGTGVLAALLARRGIARVIATDVDPRALASARDNIDRLELTESIAVEEVDLFPAGRADLIVCNPPWLPGKATSPLERSIYDAESRMLRGFLMGARAHLEPDGEAWLLLSDLAEHLGLRTRQTLLQWFDDASLVIVDRIDTRPSHSRAADQTDPLHAARSREVTSLWRLKAADAEATAVDAGATASR